MARKSRIEELAALLEKRGTKVKFTETRLNPDVIRALSKFENGKREEITVIYSNQLNAEEKSFVIEKELLHLLDTSQPPLTEGYLDQVLEGLISQKVDLALSSVIVGDTRTSEGILVEATSVAWKAVVGELKSDWNKAYQISPQKWEEIIAGAYSLAGFDSVILTPRTGDHGRDVIATRKGVGCIKIIGSVKAYHPGLKVGYDDVRALLGVMSGERDTSKGILSTTSSFPTNIMADPFIAPFVPYRLELMDGEHLRKWLVELANKNT